MEHVKPLIIANWKMQLGMPESLQLAQDIKKGISKNNPAQVVICPSFISLTKVWDILKGSGIELGAQDCFWEEQGKFTGEVSAVYLREAGCRYVILGHSERREHLKETEEMIRKKVQQALNADLTPIVCVGETFEQRQEGAKDYVVINQTTQALSGIKFNLDQTIIVAYEPVWAISPSPYTIMPSEADEMHQVIYRTLLDLFPPTMVKNNFKIIFGGSVDASDAAGFIALENTSGVLVGGASQKAKSFIDLLNSL